ncbi:MAG: hypothetical protein P8R54_17730 [Myxococcota bacterium]|nr:hypothetical protein [Myxococcota bacterium]
MKNTVLIAAAALMLSGCALKSASIPSADIPFADAGYTILGETTEESCGSYILGIDFGHLFSDQGASAGWSLISSGTPESSRALYAALAKIPEATHLLDTRIENESTGLVLGRPIFGQRCATVHAWGVKIDERPNPYQGLPPAADEE